MDPLRSKLGWSALYSRLFIWALSVVANLVIPDHDAGKLNKILFFKNWLNGKELFFYCLAILGHTLIKLLESVIV